MNVACHPPQERRPYEMDARIRGAMASRALLLALRRLHYDHAPKEYKDRFLPAYPLPNIAVAPKPTSLFLELWGEIEEAEDKVEEPVTVRRIKRAVCSYFKVTNIDLISARRTKDIVIPRQVAMYLCKHLTIHTWPQIGRAFGGRDHTTVIHAVERIDNMLLWRAEIIQAVATIRQRLS